MRKLLAVTVLFFVCVTMAQSQQRRIDSLLAVSSRYQKEDSVKVLHLKNIFRAYATVRNYAKAQVYIDSAIHVAAKLPRKRALSNVYYRAGAVFHNADRLKAINYYLLTIETARLSDTPRQEAAGYLNLGALYMGIADYPRSLEVHEKAMRLFNSFNDAGGVSSCLMNMSAIYISIGQKVKGMEYARKALKVFEEDNSHRGIAVAYEQVGDLLFSATNDELSAMGIPPADRLKELSVVLDKGLKHSLLTEDDDLKSDFYNALGRLDELKGNYPAAQKNFAIGIGLNKETNSDTYGINLVMAGQFYINRLQDFPKGMAMLHEALIASIEAGRSATAETTLLAISDAFEKQKNFDSALFYYRKAIVVKDSIFNKEKEQEVTRRQLRIDFDIKERDYQNAQQLADARLKEQQQQILLRNQQLLISDKEKTLQRLTFLQEQAALQKQKETEANLRKEEHVKAEYDKKISEQQISLQDVQLTANKWLSLGLGVVAILVFAAALLIYNSRHKTIKLNKVVSEQKLALEELVNVKDKIFSVVSHDMRGPVNNLIAFSSLLEDGDIEQERLALYMQQIKGTLDHTSALMENLLNWSASQMKGFAPVIETVDVSTAVQQALKGVEQPLHNKKIFLENTVMPGVYIKGDKNMTDLIVRNLVNNAVKFSSEGGRLELSSVQDNDKVVLTIKDNGVGMDAGKVQQINSASIHSIESSFGTAKEKGTGLGLMLSKHFAGLMGGSITVESKPGAGSRFDVSLPGAV